MRSFSKKLAFVLAAAMVFTAFAPAAKAEAADMKINKSSKILYVTDGEGINDAAQVGGGKGNVAEYDFSVSNKPKDYKTTHTFKWSSSDEDVIEVGKAGLTKAVGVGVADVVCVVTEKATGIEKTLKSTVTVKANAAEVVITNADDYDGQAVNVGETVDLNRAMYDANGTKAPKRGVVVTDYTRWMVSPEAGVKIDPTNGKYTFTEDAKAGDYTLWCETYQSSKYTKTTATSEKIVVTLVAENAFTADQKSISEFKLEFDNAVKALTKEDVTVEKVKVRNSKEYFTKMPVKAVSLAKDGMSADVTLFGSMEDANNYKITVKDFEESYVLAATVGYPEYIIVTAQVDGKDVDPLTTNVAADLVCKFYNSNDVDISAKGWPVSFSLVEYSKNGGYTLSSGKLNIKKAGEIVGVKAKSQKYENGKLVVDISDTFTFTAKDADPVYAVGVADFSLNAFASSGNKQSLQVKDKGAYTLTVKVATDDGKDPIEVKNTLQELTTVTGKPTISYTAINPEICNITAEGKLIPYKVGTAGFYVNTVTKKSNGDKVVEPFADVYIDVQADSKFDEFKLEKYDVTVGTQDGFDTATIKATAYDQYDAKYEDAKALAVAGVSDNAKAILKDGTLNLVSDNTGAEQVISIDGSVLLAKLNAVEDGKYKLNEGDAAYLEFEAKIDSYKQYFTVVVQTPSKADNNYPAIESNNTADALRVYTNNSDTKSEDAKELTFSVYQMNNNIKVANQTVNAYPTDLNTVSEGQYFYKILKNGEELKNCVTPTGNGITIALSELSDAVSGSAIGAANKTVKYDKTGAGTYTFELYRSYADKDLTQIDSSSVTVSLGDKGAYAVAGQNSNEVKVIADYDIKGNEFSTNTADKNAIVDCFKFTGRDGKEIKKDDFKKKTFDVKYDAANGTGSVFVESVTVYELLGTYNGVENYVAYDIPVNVVLVRTTK